MRRPLFFESFGFVCCEFGRRFVFMNTHARLFAVFLLCFLASVGVFAQSMCPARPASGSIVVDPVVLSSQNGVLTLNLTMVNAPGPDGVMEYCYVYSNGAEAPTLLVNPGDILTINLINHLTPIPPSVKPSMQIMSGMAGMSGSSGTSSAATSDPCSGAAMTSASTNIHFHGLNVPPVCHQDDVINTSIPANAPPFQYSLQIPANEPAGLYWYHPHPHGFTKTQVIGGAAGALIVGGIQNLKPEVAGLPQRVFVIRQQLLPNGSDESSVLSVNFVPFHENLYARILMKPAETQLWRLLNASSTQFLQLQLLNGGAPTNFQVVGLDGVPLETTETTNTVVIPPAGRAEIVVQGPPANGLYQLYNAGYDTGPIGDPNPAVLLADVIPSNNAPEPPTQVPATVKREGLQRFAGLSHLAPTAARNLYLSENTAGTQFFLTVVGQTAKLYEPNEPPAITTHQGAIEDWVIENRTTEVHAFHLHQLHFVVLEINGVATNDPAVRDTIVVPYWDGKSTTYTSVKVRIDFRDPETVGMFLYHCHILDHEDGGMMAKIQVLPSQ
jgi:FtsP/CotA-like multicopper oxidase with cupredoxin domain